METKSTVKVIFGANLLEIPACEVQCVADIRSAVCEIFSLPDGIPALLDGVSCDNGQPVCPGNVVEFVRKAGKKEGFPLFGSKLDKAGNYPKPEYDLIIEPFAGSAGYSMHYGFGTVWLNDLDKDIYDVWQYLKTADREDIERLPELKAGEDIRDFNLTNPEILLMGYAVNPYSTGRRYICTKWAEKGREIQEIKNRLLHSLERIRSWRITCGDYRTLPDIEATWIIDPPYQHGGKHYNPKNHKSFDYRELAAWCRSRPGQVIVCENELANWLPFKPIMTMNGRKKNYREYIWTNIAAFMRKLRRAV